MTDVVFLAKQMYLTVALPKPVHFCLHYADWPMIGRFGVPDQIAWRKSVAGPWWTGYISHTAAGWPNEKCGCGPYWA